jgi:hypothetical protein
MYFLTFSIKFNSAIKEGKLEASDFKMVVKGKGYSGQHCWKTNFKKATSTNGF